MVTRLESLRGRAAALGVAVALLGVPAAGASKDKAVLKEADRVMNELFATARFDEARAALERALARCKAGCSPHTQAVLHVDLGAVWITGLGDTARGTRELRAARALDPTLLLDEMVATPEVKKAFDSAGDGKKEVSVVLDEEGDEEGRESSEESEVPGRKRRKRPPEPEPAPPEREAARGPSSPSAPPAVWLSLGLIQDVAFPSGSDVCTKDSQVSGGYTCLRAAGSQYHGTPLPGRGGDLGGPSLATTRLVLATHVPLWGPLGGSLHVGYAFLGQGPQPDGGKDFVWAHAEARLAYWLTGKAYAGDDLGAFVEASGGLQEIDGHGEVKVQEDPAAPPPAHQIDNPPSQNLEAYQKGGTGFAAVGVGGFLPLGRVGVLADTRVMRLFPRGATAVSFGLSLAVGL
jgi:hypothetical protein